MPQNRLKLDDLAAGSSGFVWQMPGMVERIVDGDTIVISIVCMPGVELAHEHVRVQGINAPEMNTQAGQDAAKFAASLLKVGDTVKLSMTRRDKYGRVLAKITMPNGADFGDKMIADGHAVVDLG